MNRVKIKKVFIAVLLLVAALEEVKAHPVNELLEGAYVTLTPDAINLELDLTPGEQVSAKLLSQLDPNQDGRVSELEAHNFAQQVIKATILKWDGQPKTWTLERVIVPPYSNLTLGGDTVKIYAKSKLSVPNGVTSGAHTLLFNNLYQLGPSRYMVNIFLQPLSGVSFGVDRQIHSDDQRTLTVYCRILR